MEVAPEVPDFAIGPDEPLEETLARFMNHIKDRTHHHLGYPYNLRYDHSELFSFLQYSVNNLGDPFRSSNYGVHSRAFELAVLDFFADMWHISKEEYWGYITCSGTEGNMHGMYVARECLPAAILYLSSETHYSILKCARFYRMEACVIDTLPSGEMDYEDFHRKLEANKERGYFTAIVNVNCGTTVKGGIDNLDKVLSVLESVGIPEEQFHIHVDGALFGMILPHLSSQLIDCLPDKDVVGDSDTHTRIPVMDFTRPVKSISVSGHKMIGCPMPCGVVLHRKESISRIENHIAYLNSPDTTIMGSRNGQAALFLWLSLKKQGIEGFEKNSLKCMKNARRLFNHLREAKVGAMLNPYSNTVVLEKPFDDAFIQKWQLACTGEIAHVVVMPSSGYPKLKEFLDDLLEHRRKHGLPNRCIKPHVGPTLCRCSACDV